MYLNMSSVVLVVGFVFCFLFSLENLERNIKTYNGYPWDEIIDDHPNMGDIWCLLFCIFLNNWRWILTWETKKLLNIHGKDFPTSSFLKMRETLK